jgi:hypothetical protein
LFCLFLNVNWCPNLPASTILVCTFKHFDPSYTLCCYKQLCP